MQHTAFNYRVQAMAQVVVRENLSLLARSAIAAGADGLFVETHPNPQKMHFPTSQLSFPFQNYRPLLNKC